MTSLSAASLQQFFWVGQAAETEILSLRARVISLERSPPLVSYVAVRQMQSQPVPLRWTINKPAKDEQQEGLDAEALGPEENPPLTKTRCPSGEMAAARMAKNRQSD